MSHMEEMDEFVDWGNAMAPTGSGPAYDNMLLGDMSLDNMPAELDPDNIGLVLENVNEDDFSFCALQHFADAQNSKEQVASLGRLDCIDTVDPDQLFWETPKHPCAHCVTGGFFCKKIREGRFTGYCTSCVALRVQCNFGDAVATSSATDAATFPASADLAGLVSQGEIIGDRLQPLGSHPALEVMGMMNNPVGESKDVAPMERTAPAKIGARFSRDSVRILKTWLSTHNRHPYPSDDEKEMLQRQTGLNKTQITNWLANARRRGKVQPPRSTSPHVGNWSSSIDIPRRPGTPALEAMNPLQRWQNSPPENEPASVTAIARAVTASSSALSSGLNSPFSQNFTDDGSGRSLCNQSSASSLGTSHSGSGSRGSAYSHGSRNSWGSFGSAPFSSGGRRRRRRRATTRHPNDTSTSLAVPLKTFQCTFCTETFRTKHDWQRHEKSLHLSLERWVCAPEGPRIFNPENGQLSCAFCGIANPDDAHIETHNHSACQERSLEERTFYRKDHLNQHLRLVHNVKFMNWSMKLWKIATPQIRSRCGFCGIVMDTWTIRVDHLAEHFKTGYSMADWKGDWGFDGPVLNMVENSIPPYLIHHERVSPLPYTANQSPPESPRNAYELIKLELAYFGANHWEQYERPPTDEEMVLEGCRIIFASELLSLQGIATQPSWLRDLIMRSEDLSQKARFGRLRGAAESRLATLKINGKDNLFERCPMESQLLDFVQAKRSLGLTAMNDELQEEACRIVGRVEEVCNYPSETVANWLLRLITSSTDWLDSFRRRAHLPRTEDVQDDVIRSTDPKSIDSTIHSYSRLERELADYLKLQRTKGIEASDEDLQRKARVIIYEFDDGWNQTAADSIQWLLAFRRRHPADAEATPPAANAVAMEVDSQSKEPTKVAKSSDSSIPAVVAPHRPANNEFQDVLDRDGRPVKSGPFFLNDANCYRRLARELRRYVVSSMSPNNPSRHIPTDEELQYQARWILYDEDDPWNQTAADNAEWLQRFKRDVGIVKDSGPGLPNGYAWAVEQGGSGFAPPYMFLNGQLKPYDDDVQIVMGSGAKALTAGQSAANSFVENLTSQACRPATIFCSRELENGLARFVQENVAQHNCLPSDKVLRARAKEIINSDETAADDPVLLEKFKEWISAQLSLEPSPSSGVDTTASADTSPSWSKAMDFNISDEEIGNMLQDMDFDLAVTGAETLIDSQSSGGGIFQD